MKKKIFTLLIAFTTLWVVKANAQCTADFGRNPRTACVGSPFVFYDLSTGGSNPKTWNWNFGPGATPATFNGQNPPTVTYSTTGTKTITLTYTTNGGGCTDVQQRDVDVVPQPTVSFTSNSPQCIDQSFDFTYTGSASLTYMWDFGVGANPSSSTIQNPQGITYSSAGTKTITLTINNGTCIQTSSQTITVSATPTASFASTAPKCTGLAVDFTNTGTISGATYSWNFGSGATPATSISQNPTGVIYSTSGTKIVTLTITNSTTGCSVTSTGTININQTPTVGFTSNAPKCENSTVLFTNSSSTGIGVSYLWDFGSGSLPAASTAQNPVAEYIGSGNKTVSLIVTNEFQCSATSTATISILTNPVATFTSMSSNCTGDSVDFQNTGTASAVYSWNFGSGATPTSSSTENPQNVVYSSSGIKTVTLITTLGTCTDTSIQTLNLNQTPAPAFTHNAPQCEGSAINFTYTGTVDTNWTYVWDFGIGAFPAQSSQQNVTGVEYTSGGNKTVLLTVVNGTCSEISQQIINILSKPVATFTSMSSNCTGDSVDFQNTGTASAVYSWNFGSGATPTSSSIENPQNVVYSSSGIKTVTFITTLGTCTDTSIQTLNLNQTPAPAFTHNAPQCEGSAINFTYTGTVDTNWTYVWDFGLGAFPAQSSQQNVTGVEYTGGGNKTVLLTVVNGTCSEISQQIINIYTLPFANAGKDTTICANRTVQIGALPDSNYIYSWFPYNTLSNNLISNPVSSPIAYITNYVVIVTDTVTGCINKDSVIVTMLPPLVADAGVDVEICRNDSIQIGVGLLEGQNYLWSPSNGLDNINSPNPVAKPDSTTTYTLTVNGLGCQNETDEVTVIVHQLPKIDAGLNDSITHGSSTQLIATGGVQYTWSPSLGLDNIGIYNPVAFPDITTTYNVVGIDIYGCMNNDSVIVYVIIPSVWLPSAFTPDDNGKNDVYNVRGEGINNFEFAIFNSWGETVFYSKNISYGWDGRKQGTNELLPQGAYAYYVKGVLTNGEAVNISGIVNLIR